MKTGKKQKVVRKDLVPGKKYSVVEALSQVHKSTTCKFDETVDVAVRLGVDAKQGDQQVRAAVVLPHGLGKSKRVLVFAKGPKEAEAKEAGADVVGAEDLIEKINGGWLDFDVAVATPDMMGVVGRVAKILGPRGLMPNPKLGTVTLDVKKAVQENKAGKVEFRTEKSGIVHAPIGKVSFGPEKLKDNLKAVLDTVRRLKPVSSKGVYFKGLAVSSSMGPGFRVDTAEINHFLES